MRPTLQSSDIAKHYLKSNSTTELVSEAGKRNMTYHFLVLQEDWRCWNGQLITFHIRKWLRFTV
jgi:hypothetical protein